MRPRGRLMFSRVQGSQLIGAYEGGWRRQYRYLYRDICSGVCIWAAVNIELTMPTKGPLRGD